MLVLTRRQSEVVVIRTPSGERIEVVVTAIRGNRVLLGVAAPESFKIEREEPPKREVSR